MIVIIGKRMQWSKEIDAIATALAEVVEEELSMCANMNSRDEEL